MPADLSPEFFNAEAHFKKVQTYQEKLNTREETLLTIPKHKETTSFHDAKEGVAQCVLPGPPKETGDYVFAAVKPQPGMLKHKNIASELINLSVLSSEYRGSRTSSIIRSSNILLFIIGMDQKEYLPNIKEDLQRINIELVPCIDTMDRLSSTARISIRLRFSCYKIFPVSCYATADEASIGAALFKKLKLVRVYTKAPGKKPDFDQPDAVKTGAALLEAANTVHQYFAVNMKYARVRSSTFFDGLRITKDDVLSEGESLNSRYDR